MPRAGSPYGAAYQRARAALLASRPRCHVCGYLGADSADHVPALYEHRHVEGTGCCRLLPAHLRCNVAASGGWRASWRARRARQAGESLQPTPEPSRHW